MKKFLFLCSLTLSLIFTACSNDDDLGGEVLQPVSFTVNLAYTEDFGGDPANGVTVTLTETSTAQVYTGESNAKGVVFFEAVQPGTYDLSATISFTGETFEARFGFSSEQEAVNFNGGQEKVVINENTAAASVELKTSRVGDLLIKQIYYAGSDTKDGAVFRDQFIEIYNNSNEVIHADGLYVAQLYGEAALRTPLEDYHQPNGQYDWSQSIDMNNDPAANTDYVYADFIFRVPGSGEEYPIEPGESIIIAQTAVNHKENYIDNDGDMIEINNPDLTVDLSNADFEVYVGNGFGSDIQTPVTDMEIAYFRGGNDMVFDTNGRDGFAIFRTDEEIDTYPLFRNPDEDADNEPKYKQIPNSLLIDAVDITREDQSTPKKLQAEFDATSIFCPAGRFSSQSVIRKTKTTIAGRIVLEDTNNSEADFTVLEKATPRGFAE